ncbi:hypothetical protein MKZ38_007109 [Zalerion maritima]|uniref:Uncharacterized protein n=1 Tax=Zalerion maritima TaxID=339359 RepID=A0AAD5WN38_9PEZI|nr:hypothetical protein MKZ38_007109 [Zalerion maritima]
MEGFNLQPPPYHDAEKKKGNLLGIGVDVKRFIAIGIDFGTTFSGVSWAYSEDPENIRVVTRWPGPDGTHKDEQQVPTKIDLSTEDWGYMVTSSSKAARWFKLLLLDEDTLPNDVKNCEALKDVRAKLSTSNVTVVGLVGKFLKKVWTQAIAEISREIGDDELEFLPFKVAITIPAIWPLKARNDMKKAAEMAGILEERDVAKTEFMLVEEPEAAAVATLLERRAYPEMKASCLEWFALRAWETFVVCDCGGGTVDLSSYKIKSLIPFKVEETVQGDGKLCGAFMVDDAFENHVKTHPRLKFESDQEFRDFVQDEWETTLKRTFNGRETSNFSIRAPMRRNKFQFAGKPKPLQLAVDEIKGFFNGSVQGINEVLKKQVDEIQMREGKKPKKILLVGGLGSSIFIFNELNDKHQAVLQPWNPWSAVSRGATWKILQHAFCSQADILSDDQSTAVARIPNVTSRISKLSYGTLLGWEIPTVDPPFDSTVEQKWTCPDGCERVNRMQWYIKKGERLEDKSPTETTTRAFVHEDAKSKTQSLAIYTSRADVPPVRQDNSVERSYTLSCDIDVPLDQLPQCRMDPKYRKAAMDVGMIFEGEPKWTVKIGKNKTERKADVEFLE